MRSNKLHNKLISGEEKAILADKGYANQRHKRQLRDRGIFCGILDKGYRNQPLSAKQETQPRTFIDTQCCGAALCFYEDCPGP